jgi:DUF1680 family protein
MSLDHDPSLGPPGDREPGAGPASLSRRELIATLGRSAAGAALLAALPSSLPAAHAPVRRTGAPVAARLRAAELRDVRLLDGPFREAQQRDARYLLSLEPDRMLHNFRVNAGLPPKAPVYGGWESREPWIDIRCHGHTLGHYLSAVAMMWAATGDERFRSRSDYIVAELAACQAASGTGLVCAFPDGALQLQNAVAGREFVGVPWYTMHKIFAGLRDARIHTGSAEAGRVLQRLAQWVWDATHAMSDEAMQHMLDREHGGMNEVLADASVLANEPRFLELARRFSHRRLLDPLADGRDVLDGLHSNTQIPKVIGFQRLYELTGERRYADASRFFWHTVVEGRSFATGGNGDKEHFFPPAEFRARLASPKTMETCCTHNMLRLTRELVMHEPRAEYADYYERALYNGILASQDPDSGMMTYFQATRPGYLKLYNTPVDSFWCCTGTGMENHAKYGDSIYFVAPRALYVNLFIPSTLRWRERRLTVTQTTRFPDEEATRLTISAASPARAAIHVRHPSWCRALDVRVNGRPHLTSHEPGRFVAIERRWRDGDVIDVRLPMTLRTVPLPGTTDVVAIAYGPIVLAGLLGRDGITPGSDIIVNERESGTMLNEHVDVPVLVGEPATIAARIERASGTALAFRTAGLGRPHDVTLVPYHRVAHERYSVYWSVVPA